MFWKQSEEGLETEETCSAWAGNGQKGCCQSFPLGYGAVLMDFEGKTWRTSRQSAAAALSLVGLELRNGGVRNLVKNPPGIRSNSPNKIIKDAP